MKDSLFNKQENWRVTCKRMELGHHLTPYTKLTQIKHLNRWSGKDERVRRPQAHLLPWATTDEKNLLMRRLAEKTF